MNTIEDLKTIGILGGMSSAATGEYYSLINEKVKAIKGGHTIAELMICSVNFANIARFIKAEDWDAAAVYLVAKAKSVENAGATHLFLATNTMHKVRAQIKEAIAIPFIDIFETVSNEIKQQGKSKIGILGTYPVMTDQFYVDAYKQFNVELIAPDEPEKKEIDRIIFEELTNHKFTPASKAYFIKVMQQLTNKGAEGIILGCTEIKMLVNETDVADIALFDSTDLHCQLAAKICTGQITINE